MTCTDLLTPQALRALLTYDPTTGALSWRHRNAETLAEHGLAVPDDVERWNARHAGADVALSDDGHGYPMLMLFSRPYRAHRVAWALHHGAWPIGNVRLRNSDRTDGRLANMRVPPRPRPRGLPRVDNQSGVAGVHWRRTKGVWRARIGVAGERVELGEFARFRDAVLARREAEARYGRAEAGEL
ncbi:HNH endonuclease [Sphingopyxis sp.]|uniref:HNH endonuclease n=1 Tax=Sphingopyxis sp. TaxID=1908224 RepID=UPI001DAA8A4A|nr:HNH endonuclease [Sphingopyxis sp.]MBW8296168.1 HNH endonuclease [Sphingopyxis sp.]